MTQALGSEINDFYNNHWPGEGFYHNDYADWLDKSFVEDGKSYKLDLEPTALFDLDDFGDLVHDELDICNYFEVFFLKWKENSEYFYLNIKLKKLCDEDKVNLMEYLDETLARFSDEFEILDV